MSFDDNRFDNNVVGCQRPNRDVRRRRHRRIFSSGLGSRYTVSFGTVQETKTIVLFSDYMNLGSPAFNYGKFRSLVEAVDGLGTISSYSRHPFGTG